MEGASRIVQCRGARRTSVLSPVRVHYRQTYIEVKYLDCGAFANTYLAISKTNANAVLARYNVLSSDCLNELRQNVVVIKSDKPRSSHNSLKKEIMALVHVLNAHHPQIVRWVDYHDDDDEYDGIAWLAMSYCNGPPLRHVFDIESRLPQAFIWHVGLALAQALLFLHFGINQANGILQPVNNWTSIAHADIHEGNIMLHNDNSSTGFGNYPSIILIDFGQAHIDVDYATPFERETHQDRLLRDISNLHTVITQFFPDLSCATMRHWMHCFRYVEIDAPNVLPVLLDFAEAASVTRTHQYAPLSPEILARLEVRRVSDLILQRALEEQLHE